MDNFYKNFIWYNSFWSEFSLKCEVVSALPLRKSVIVSLIMDQWNFNKSNLSDTSPFVDFPSNFGSNNSRFSTMNGSNLSNSRMPSSSSNLNLFGGSNSDYGIFGGSNPYSGSTSNNMQQHFNGGSASSGMSNSLFGGSGMNRPPQFGGMNSMSSMTSSNSHQSSMSSMNGFGNSSQSSMSSMNGFGNNPQSSMNKFNNFGGNPGNYLRQQSAPAPSAGNRAPSVFPAGPPSHSMANHSSFYNSNGTSNIFGSNNGSSNMFMQSMNTPRPMSMNNSSSSSMFPNNSSNYYPGSESNTMGSSSSGGFPPIGDFKIDTFSMNSNGQVIEGAQSSLDSSRSVNGQPPGDNGQNARETGIIEKLLVRVLISVWYIIAAPFYVPYYFSYHLPCYWYFYLFSANLWLHSMLWKASSTFLPLLPVWRQYWPSPHWWPSRIWGHIWP